jgi:hypothetical protein
MVSHLLSLGNGRCAAIVYQKIRLEILLFSAKKSHNGRYYEINGMKIRLHSYDSRERFWLGSIAIHPAHVVGRNALSLVVASNVANL